MGEMRFHGGGEERKDVAALLAAGLDHRQHRLDEPAAAGALCPKRELPPDYRMTQRPLARIVRRLDPFVTQETSTATRGVRTIPGTFRAPLCSRSACRAAANAPPCGGLAPSDAPSRPRNPAGPILGPMLEQLAGGPPQAFSQPFRPRIARVDHGLEIALQMRPAPLQPLHAPVHLRPIAGDHAAKLSRPGRRPVPWPRAWHAPRTP